MVVVIIIVVIVMIEINTYVAFRSTHALSLQKGSKRLGSFPALHFSDFLKIIKKKIQKLRRLLQGGQKLII